MTLGVWSVFASPAASVIVGLICVACLIWKKAHRASNGKLDRRKLASVVIVGASTYTFIVLALSDIILKGPPISTLIEHGFGNHRVAWLVLGVAIDGVFRVWDEFQ